MGILTEMELTGTLLELNGTPRVAITAFGTSYAIIDTKHGGSVFGCKPMSKEQGALPSSSCVEVSSATVKQINAIAEGYDSDISSKQFRDGLRIICEINDIGNGTVERSPGVSIPARELTVKGVASAFTGWEPGDWQRA
jgi:hypothetical protein